MSNHSPASLGNSPLHYFTVAIFSLDLLTHEHSVSRNLLALISLKLSPSLQLFATWNVAFHVCSLCPAHILSGTYHPESVGQRSNGADVIPALGLRFQQQLFMTNSEEKSA